LFGGSTLRLRLLLVAKNTRCAKKQTADSDELADDLRNQSPKPVAPLYVRGIKVEDRGSYKYEGDCCCPNGPRPSLAEWHERKNDLLHRQTRDGEG